jgi:hypothetical protein
VVNVEHLRTTSRVDLRVPVLFEWRDGGAKHQAAGISRDVSPEGLYVLSDVCPRRQSVTRCRLVLPALETASPEVIGGVITADGLRSKWYATQPETNGSRTTTERYDTTYEAIVIGRVTRTDHNGAEQVGFALRARLMLLRQPHPD